MSVCRFILIFIFMWGVDADEVKSVSVTEGDSVTLSTDVTETLTDDQILWRFGPKNARIAEIYHWNPPIYDNIEIFRDRLKLENETGSLRITNIRITDSGVYKLHIIRSTGTLYKTFTVFVNPRLPDPVIIRNSSQCSSSSGRSSVSKCVLLCSVMNVTHVSLSWYKGNSLLSNISVSDHNIKLSLPLEVEYQDTNTYRCVINNTISNHTQHLNITDVCQPCSGLTFIHKLGMCCAALGTLKIVSTLLIICFCRKHRLNEREHTQSVSK
ncbi:titin-like isoform X1 [Triplophysa dalaica]|uniref:titin-like isoform X1 n=1 Tax=Triplophysa dalaica TaxID=1582913 RepID=UPI0024DF377B|nr:titin-like isoform X1 [Triplophysa dalaica]